MKEKKKKEDKETSPGLVRKSRPPFLIEKRVGRKDKCGGMAPTICGAYRTSEEERSIDVDDRSSMGEEKVVEDQCHALSVQDRILRGRRREKRQR